MAVTAKTPIMNSVSVTTSSTLLLAANGRRRYAEFVNPSSAYVWLSFGAPALVGYGACVPPGGGYIIDEQNMTHAAIYGISSSGTVAVGTLEMI